MNENMPCTTSTGLQTRNGDSWTRHDWQKPSIGAHSAWGSVVRNGSFPRTTSRHCDRSLTLLV